MLLSTLEQVPGKNWTRDGGLDGPVLASVFKNTYGAMLRHCPEENTSMCIGVPAH